MIVNSECDHKTPQQCHMNELNKKSHIIQCSAAQINTTVQLT